ncbi:IPT/TIG domain-containing protein [Runella salmonicolor]|uniref:IPT/TIG domain-containing protein n=1 Tax=Runella salmonicolor TaxID=2950278 RepID=A0ABT1FX09_9BACT|nr:IPT/TIG domain-containing protein [Runella salmonicolor]MCP1386246.1 IPT/TIG domain-containing protein [Runella salmonicolor]
MRIQATLAKWIWVLLPILLLQRCKPQSEPMPPENQGILVTVKDQKTNKEISNAIVSWAGPQSGSGSTDKDGTYKKGNLPIGKYQVTVSATNYQKLPAGKEMEVSNGVMPTAIFLLNSERQISFDKPSPLRINANDKAVTLRLTNVGNRGPIRILINPDNNKQWLVVTPKDPVPIAKDQSLAVTLAVDSRTLNIGEHSANIRFEYTGDNGFSDYDDYVLIVSVTTPPISVTPVISNILPQAGGYDTNVTITGQNFETDTSKVQVLFGGDRKAVITNWSVTEYRVRVPVGAKTDNIKVRIGQNTATSNAVFTYNLTCTVSTIASLRTSFFINDITVAEDGTIYLAGVELKPNSNEIAQAGIYRIPRGSGVETAMLEREAGFANGDLSTTAQMVNPTKIEAVNNELYIADQYDNTRYRANHSEGYASIRRIANGQITATPAPYYQKIADRVFINEILHIPKFNFNGILFADGAAYKKYGLDGSRTDLTNYQGFTVFMDFDGNDVYTLDLEPENNPTTWRLRKRTATALQNTTLLASGALGISRPDLAPDRTNYPKGMAIDPNNQCAYVFDRNSNGGFLVHRVNLTNGTSSIIYNAPSAATSLENGLLIDNGSKANFAAISCLTYDDTRKAVLLVDVFRANTVRAMECR